MMWRSHAPQFALWAGAMLALFILSAAVELYRGLRSASGHETIANFAADSGHCGRCEYDLTGNASGICPECGWVIPQGALDVDSPGWVLWWRKWEIGHLRRWRAKLGMLLFNFLLFTAGAAAGAIYLKNVPMAVMMGIMAILMSINILRVVRYGMNEARQANTVPRTGRWRGGAI
jgi:hypothetical protein